MATAPPFPITLAALEEYRRGGTAPPATSARPITLSDLYEYRRARAQTQQEADYYDRLIQEQTGRAPGIVGRTIDLASEALDLPAAPARALARRISGLPPGAPVGRAMSQALFPPEQDPTLLSNTPYRMVPGVGAVAAAADVYNQIARAIGMAAPGAAEYAKAPARAVTNIATEASLNPVTALAPAQGTAGKVASGLFSATMGKGTLEGAEQTAEQLSREGLTPSTLQSALETAASAYLFKKAGQHALPGPGLRPAVTLPDETYTSAVGKLGSIVGAAEEAGGIQARLTTEQRAKIARDLSQIQARERKGDITPEESIALQKQAMSGEYPEVHLVSSARPGETPPSGQMFQREGDVHVVYKRPVLSQDEVTSLFQRIAGTKDIDMFERYRASNALYNLLDPENTSVPPKNERATLRDIFGLSEEQITEIKKATLKEQVVDALGLPRALITAFDLSFPLRQGLFALTTLPVSKIHGPFVDMLRKAFGSASIDDINAEILSRPRADEYIKNDIGLVDPRSRKFTSREEAVPTGTAALTDRERTIAAKIAGMLPGTEAYTAFGNRLRADLYDYLAGLAEKEGVDLSKGGGERIGEFVRAATGRSNIPFLQAAQPFLNMILFSPRFQGSRMALLKGGVEGFSRLPAGAQQAAARGFYEAMGAGMTVLSLASLNGADVEMDPRSADFAKIKLGEGLRYDIWGGLQPYARLAAQVATALPGMGHAGYAERIPTTGPKAGIPQLVGLNTLAAQFAEQRLSPLFSGAIQYYRGEETPLETIGSQLVPMAIQDIYSQAREGRPRYEYNLPIFGMSVQRYGAPEQELESRVNRIKRRIDLAQAQADVLRRRQP